MSNKYPLLFGTYQGEVIGVSKGSGEGLPALIKYDVKVTFTNGSSQIVPNVRMASMFGGIGDTFQARLLGTGDIEEFDYNGNGTNDDAYAATCGSRVIVVFMAGHINFPVIVGYLNHPRGSRFYSNHADLNPQTQLTVLGMTFRIDDKGAFEIVHRGAPEVAYDPDYTGDSPSLPDPTADPSKPADNDALTPADESETVRFKMFTGGGFRINDSVGQMIEMDQTKNRIYISNNDLKSTDVGSAFGPQITTNDTDAEYLLLDRDKKLVLINAREIIQLYSFGKRKDVTEGDHTHHILGDEKITVDGDKADKYGGEWKYSVEGDLKPSVSGDYVLDVKGDFKTTVKGTESSNITGDFTRSAANIDLSASEDWNAASGGASISMTATGQLAITGASGEILDLISQILKAIQQITVPTSPGGGTSGPPINIADFVQLQTKFDTMKA